jgi:hypothetical protein
MARDGAPLAILATLIVAFITLGAGACFWALDRMHGFERSCQQAGGHTVDIYKGQLCVSPDGRVIEPRKVEQ